MKTYMSHQLIMNAYMSHLLIMNAYMSHQLIMNAYLPWQGCPLGSMKQGQVWEHACVCGVCVCVWGGVVSV